MPGAVGIVQLEGDVERALAAIGVAPVAVGEVSLRDLMGLDRGLVARFSAGMCQLMPHGGVGVLRRLAAKLSAAGLPETAPHDVRASYPEAGTEVEAHMLAALARAASPLAVDLLLDQPRRWGLAGTLHDDEHSRTLNRLIDPPLVVALGASNIGKSTLVNALAGRGVSIVADEPGTTRDHVGVMIDCAGLVVRYIDTPGLRAGAGDLESEALEMALAAGRRADLVLVCGDATAAPPPLALHARQLTIALRTDLGVAPFAADARVSVRTGAGMPELVAQLRETLVPATAREDPRPWRFW